MDQADIAGEINSKKDEPERNESPCYDLAKHSETIDLRLERVKAVDMLAQLYRPGLVTGVGLVLVWAILGYYLFLAFLWHLFFG